MRALERINPLLIAFVILYVGIALWKRSVSLRLQPDEYHPAGGGLSHHRLGQTFVISSRGIDLSVGSVLGFVGCVVAQMVDTGTPVPIGIVVAVVLGTAFGTINGIVITKLKVNPLIATLGCWLLCADLPHILMGGTAVTRLPSSLVFLGQGFVGPVPMPAIISICVAAVCWWLYFHTRFGRYTMSIGSNEEACGLTGILVDRQKILIYALQGACVGLAAVLLVRAPERGLAGPRSELRTAHHCGGGIGRNCALRRARNNPGTILGGYSPSESSRTGWSWWVPTSMCSGS